jgi:hypothetical protein
MALWGNNDNIQTFGTVSLSGNTVTGTGTTFTTDVEVGQVIRFGVRGGAGTYYGDAEVVGITSARILTIGSTAGLAPALYGAGSTSYYISELPQYTVLDSSYSERNYAAPSAVQLPGFTGTATTNAGIGTNIIPVVPPTGVQVGDILVNGGNNILISATTLTTVSLASTISAGISTGDSLTFKRLTDGYDKIVYGISTTTSGSYHVAHEGWVGVQTYIDTHGNLRVKSEVLVAASGITTGAYGIAYPTDV